MPCLSRFWQIGIGASVLGGIGGAWLWCQRNDHSGTQCETKSGSFNQLGLSSSFPSSSSSSSSSSPSPHPSPFSYVRAITFDLDDTLWDAAIAVGNARAAFGSFLANHFPAISQKYDIDAIQNSMKRIAAERPEISHDYTLLRSEALRAACIECGEDPTKVIPGAMLAWQTERNAVTLFPGVLPLLERLRRRSIKIGVITNGNADVTQIPGLNRLVDFVIRASEIGAAKPHRSLFDAAAKAANVPHSAILHIGDDLHCDVFGAKLAGFRTIWIHKKAQKMTHEEIRALRLQNAEHADEIVHDISLLESILEPWLPPHTTVSFETDADQSKESRTIAVVERS